MKIEMKKIALPPVAVEKLRKPKPLQDTVNRWHGSDKIVKACQRRKLEVVANTLADGRVVVSIDGCEAGVARGLRAAFHRAVREYDKANKPKRQRKKP